MKYKTKITVQKRINVFIVLTMLLALQSCIKEEALPVTADFELEVFNNDFSVPVEVLIFNATKGAENYLWTFEGAIPRTSTQRNPGIITYNAKGQYTISLTATNDDGSTDTLSRTLSIEDPISIDFSVSPEVDFFSPSVLNISNTTQGATAFLWTFEDGIPATSTAENPRGIVFTRPGRHSITLEARNVAETQTLTQNIEIAPLLIPDFDVAINFEDDDQQAPVTVQLSNTSTSATSFSWEFTGATTASSTLENPTVTFNEAGLQSMRLTATNGKETQTLTKTIEVFEDTNLRVLSGIQLGINTAHSNNTIGAAYALNLRRVFSEEDINADNAAEIDFFFFGLNNRFTRNIIVAPNNLENTTFTAIPNAKNTQIINNLENCNCGISITNAQFEAMENDALLTTFNVNPTEGGSLPFDGLQVPRFVIFQTADGRKGVMRITRFVDDSTNAFIEVDIKVQKVAR